MGMLPKLEPFVQTNRSVFPNLRQFKVKSSKVKLEEKSFSATEKWRGCILITSRCYLTYVEELIHHKTWVAALWTKTDYRMMTLEDIWYSYGRRKGYVSQFHFAEFHHYISHKNCPIFPQFDQLFPKNIVIIMFQLFDQIMCSNMPHISTKKNHLSFS